MTDTSRRVDDCVRTIMRNARGIPVRIMQRGPSEGPPGDLAESTSADDLHRFEWVLRAKLFSLVRSVLAAHRKKAVKENHQ